MTEPLNISFSCNGTPVTVESDPGESLLSVHYFIVDYVWLMIVGVLGYRFMRAKQMATQYSWAFERSGLNWRAKGSG